MQRLAAVRMAAECPGHPLQPTALVHEIYLDVASEQRFDGPGHVFAATGDAMRLILVSRARPISATLKPLRASRSRVAVLKSQWMVRNRGA
jgi:hypothetical protein